MDTSDTTRSGPHRLRTSDPEREQIAEILRAAMAEGRLSLAEGSDRMGTAYAARYRDELAPLTADLPDGGRRALAATPPARAATRRAVQRRVGGVLLVAVLLTGLWTLSQAHFFWPAIPLLFLVLGMRRHAGHGHRARTHPYRQQVRPWNMPDAT